MTAFTQQIFKKALALPPAERAALIDKLISSLERPDPDLDELWASEAEDRLSAYRTGELDAIPAEDVLQELKDI